MSSGPYQLDGGVERFRELREFYSTEYSIVGKSFEGEIDFNAPKVEFLGRRWNLQLGTVHGRIYKMAPHLEFTDKQSAHEAAQEVLRYCYEGSASQPNKKQGCVQEVL